MQGRGTDTLAACGTMTDDMKAREAAALADFRDYIHVNYGPGCVLSDPQWHAPKLFRAAVGSYLASLPVPPTVNVSAIMMQLEDAVDACADQPLHMDRMTLTRTWRGILDAALSGRPVAL